MIVDVHCHIHDGDFDADRDAVLALARRAGVVVVLTMGEDAPDNDRVLQTTHSRATSAAVATVLPCLGLHPTRLGDSRRASAACDEVEAQIRLHANHLAAIGEVGLDYWEAKDEPARAVQRRVFGRLTALATELDLPLSVHSRSAGHHAIALLEELGARRVCLHAFDGSAKHAVRAYEQLGFLFSVPPSVVRSPQKQKLVRRLPLEALLVETDSPVLGPDRNRRNAPVNAVVALEEIARIKRCATTTAVDVTTRNARVLFQLDRLLPPLPALD